MKQTIEWKKVNLQGENKNLPEANRYIYFKLRYKDVGSKTKCNGISTGFTTLNGMRCVNYKSLPEGTIYVRMSNRCSYPIAPGFEFDTGFEWAYADEE